MASRYMRTAKKLQTACRKVFGEKLLIDQRQWYSKDKDMAITCYSLQKVMDDERDKRKHVELFKTYSQVQLVLFLRDYWYELNGWEVPHDNEKWEELKAKYGQSSIPSDVSPQQADHSGYTIDATGADFYNELRQNG